MGKREKMENILLQAIEVMLEDMPEEKQEEAEAKLRDLIKDRLDGQELTPELVRAFLMGTMLAEIMLKEDQGDGMLTIAQALMIRIMPKEKDDFEEWFGGAFKTEE